MDVTDLILRRATVDDLPQLIELWKAEQLPWQEMERRLTEFQVAEDGTGNVLGAIGVQIAAHQGHIHSEVFRQWELADALRTRFWERIESLAHNHGLTRFWTMQTTPFWHGYGFRPPAAEQREVMPPEFGDPAAAWLMLTLREAAPAVDLDKEFNVFREAERARTETAFRQARRLKQIATVLAILLFLGVLIGMSYLVFRTQQPVGR